MTVNLSNFINSNDKVFNLKGSIDLNKSKYVLDDYKINFPILYEGNIYRLEDELLLNLNINYSYHTQCGRCLIDMVDDVNTNIEIYLVDSAALKYEDEDLQEYYETKDSNLDLEDLIFSQVITSMPLSALCDPNCKGICSNCGQDLNKGLCNCEIEVVDHRFADLLNLFNDEEEV